jgi:hypothetical protein
MRAGLQFVSHNDSRTLCRYWLIVFVRERRGIMRQELRGV